MTGEELREYHRAWRAKNIDIVRERGRVASAKIRMEDPERSRGTKKKSYHNNPKSRMISSARKRAEKAGVPFDITADDIEIPTHCPVFGFELVCGPGDRNTSPSLDRIHPELGYVRGNIQVISTRANRIKNDATAEEMQMLAEFMARVKATLH